MVTFAERIKLPQPLSFALSMRRCRAATHNNEIAMRRSVALTATVSVAAIRHFLQGGP
jgi:hypothetical protein